MLARVKRYYMFAKQTKDTVFDFTTPYVRLFVFYFFGLANITYFSLNQKSKTMLWNDEKMHGH